MMDTLLTRLRTYWPEIDSAVCWRAANVVRYGHRQVIAIDERYCKSNFRPADTVWGHPYHRRSLGCRPLAESIQQP